MAGALSYIHAIVPVNISGLALTIRNFRLDVHALQTLYTEKWQPTGTNYDDWFHQRIADLFSLAAADAESMLADIVSLHDSLPPVAPETHLPHEDHNYLVWCLSPFAIVIGVFGTLMGWFTQCQLNNLRNWLDEVQSQQNNKITCCMCKPSKCSESTKSPPPSSDFKKLYSLATLPGSAIAHWIMPAHRFGSTCKNWQGLYRLLNTVAFPSICYQATNWKGCLTLPPEKLGRTTTSSCLDTHPTYCKWKHPICMTAMTSIWFYTSLWPHQICCSVFSNDGHSLSPSRRRTCFYRPQPIKSWPSRQTRINFPLNCQLSTSLTVTRSIRFICAKEAEC